MQTIEVIVGVVSFVGGWFVGFNLMNMWLEKQDKL